MDDRHIRHPPGAHDKTILEKEKSGATFVTYFRSDECGSFAQAQSWGLMK